MNEEQAQRSDSKRSRSFSSVTPSVNGVKKRTRTSIYENAAQIAANGLTSLGASVVEAQQILASSLESKFSQSVKILWDMKMSDSITEDEYIQICQKFRTEEDSYAEMFMAMVTEDLKLKWLRLEGLII